MESCDSSPNYMRPDAMKENSPQGGSECDDITSISSSTRGSTINNNGINYRTNKKTVKNFGNVKSFRRRAKSRIIQSPVTMSDDSLIDSSESSPHYLKATTCSESKKMHSGIHESLSRTSSFRNVRILIKKTSFKPRRLNYTDGSVDRATYSSTIKDTKFPKVVEVHNGGVESEKYPPLKVCRYHHCSLHGHCHGGNDPVPPLKRFLYKRRRSMKKQRNLIPKADQSKSKEKNMNLQKSEMVPVVEGLDLDKNDVDSYAEPEIQEWDVMEVAFGETSYPERSYEETLNILRKYSSEEQSCYCHKTESRAGELKRSPSILDDGSNNEICTQSGNADVLDASSINTVEYNGTSHNRTSTGSNSEDEGEFTTESTPDVNKVDDSEANSRVGVQFTKQRHISMWNLIHQHMSSTSANESPANGTNGKETSISNMDFSDSETSTGNNDSDNQEIEIRKLFAIKLVREAIEKILLPEVQDQASDDQSVMSETSPQPQLIEKNQTEGESNVSSNANEESRATDEIKETEESDVTKSGKKSPKHWSNLKKWILLQRFIRALEKVRKFNPRKPTLLPLNPDPEAEKVNLRPQMVDERRNAEEWMLDYALRQAVDQLAPTQKKKVALLVKAFETVVPSQEEPQVQLRTPRCLAYNISKKDGDGAALILESENRETGTGSIPDGNGEPVATDKIEKEAMPLVQGLQEDTISDSIGENTRDNGTGSIPDGNGEPVATDKTEREAMPIVQGLQEHAISDSIGENMRNYGQDRKSHIKMWHMIYQHVVSGIAEKVGKQLLDGSSDDDDEVEDKEAPARKDHESEEQHHGFTKSDALKLIKEAVDEILVPDVQDDSSDTQSVTSESISDQDTSESNVMHEDAKTDSQVSKTFELRKSRNWGKLKKLILLRRSIQALEKSREFKPQPGTLLPLMSDPEPEKVDLKNQMIDECNKAEQWMLDYAVQHIVTKLTPTRKRRVSMLVEAFEAVVPFPEM